MTKRSGRLVLCSYGLNVNQMTLETLAALRDCDVVYSQVLSDESKRSLERVCPAIETLKISDLDGIVEFLISQVGSGRRVAYLTYGDPMILNQCCEMLAARCEKDGLDYRVYLGISYLNELLGVLRLATHGASGVHISWLGAEASAFDVRVPVLVFLFGEKSNKYGVADRLIEALKSAYPEEHELEVLTFVSSGSAQLDRKKYRVRELRRAWEEARAQSTLYIPAGARRRGGARARAER
jgi:siroheme synthase